MKNYLLEVRSERKLFCPGHDILLASLSQKKQLGKSTRKTSTLHTGMEGLNEEGRRREQR
jgi:hypothetical protein